MLTKEDIAKRIAREIKDGYYVNLGIGIPTLVANYIPEGMDVVLQSENGLLGMGPFPFEGEEDPDLINADVALMQNSFVVPDAALSEIAHAMHVPSGSPGPAPQQAGTSVHS